MMKITVIIPRGRNLLTIVYLAYHIDASFIFRTYKVSVDIQVLHKKLEQKLAAKDQEITELAKAKREWQEECEGLQKIIVDITKENVEQQRQYLYIPALPDIYFK